MLKIKCGVLYRINLKNECKDKAFKEVHLGDFHNNSRIQYSDVSVILFVDESQIPAETKILKNTLKN